MGIHYTVFLKFSVYFLKIIVNKVKKIIMPSDGDIQLRDDLNQPEYLPQNNSHA